MPSHSRNTLSTANPFCRRLVEIACMHGVRTAVCSPGSRNTPLLLAVAGQEGLASRVCIDERSAAFMALGEALVSRRPVMLVCTSGTALLNYAPAVAESYYAGVPLIVVSADRPMEWIDQDDSQTLRQFEALGQFVKKSYDLPVWRPDMGRRGQELDWFVERSVNDAMLTATRPKEGPVHINIQISEPLGAMERAGNAACRFIDELLPSEILPKEEVGRLAETLAERKVLLLCGFASPDHAMRRSVGEFSRLPNVVVVAETLANLSQTGSDHCAIDALLGGLDEAGKERLRPDVVITTGGALVSRMVKEWLRNCKPDEHWSLGHNRTTVDCLQSLTLRIEANPAKLLHKLAVILRRTPPRKSSKAGDYARQWRLLGEETDRRCSEYLKSAPWSDLKAWSMLSAAFPQRANLFLSNGTAVRYDQLFQTRSHATFCNRGVSGIDGSASTAIGGAWAYASGADGAPKRHPEGQTVLVTGDMSMTYDIGALASGPLPDGMKIIVMNNGGGGIFRFIRSTAQLPEELLDRYFCANPRTPFAALCKAYGLAYAMADSEESLREQIDGFYASPRAALLEIRTDGQLSAEVLRAYLNPGAS